MARIELDTLRKVYPNGVEAVRGATFAVEDGEFVVFVGPSGCGKTTLLRMIAGLEDITDGTLSIGGRVVNDVPPMDRDVAMVFQNYALYPHMSVYDNMAFGLRRRKHAKAEVDRRVREAAGVLGLDGVLERKPKELSGGQRQRVAVGRAIVRQPQVFLFDEPLSNLDAKLRVQMRTELSKLHRRLGATMVYVTHDQVEALTMGDRIVVLEGGVVQQIDTPMGLYHRPVNRFVAGFIGSPAMNFFEGAAAPSAGGARFEADDAAFAVGLPDEIAACCGGGRRLTLGIRPEAVSVAAADAPAAGRWTLEVVEPMGNEIVLYARSGPHAIVARVPPQRLPEPGAKVSLAFDLDGLHAFDADSGAVLAGGRPEPALNGVL